MGKKCATQTFFLRMKGRYSWPSASTRTKKESYLCWKVLWRGGLSLKRSALYSVGFLPRELLLPSTDNHGAGLALRSGIQVDEAVPRLITGLGNSNGASRIEVIAV